MTILCYAGIGSRHTPTHILKIMHHLACHLYTQGWTLRSGGAAGADSAFEAGADNMVMEKLVSHPSHVKHIYLPWAGYNGSPSDLHPQRIPFTDEEERLTQMFHPAWSKCTGSVQRLHMRNTRIILGSSAVDGEIVNPVKFVICWTENGLVQGGTGQALRIAQSMDLPIINFGQAKNTEHMQDLVKMVHTLSDRFMTEMGDVSDRTDPSN